MQFLNPIWLWGLTALAIPFAIHLLSRREGNVIRIGSIRHLEETSSKQFKSFHLNEVALLFLRCSLITLLVLFLSGLRLPGLERAKKLLLIEPGLDRDTEFSVLIDSLKRNGFEPKLLSEGFPDLSDGVSNIKKPDYWNLLSQLKKQPTGQALVLSNNYAESFRGKRLSLPENIRWVAKDPEKDQFALNAIRLSNDSVSVRIGNTSPEKTAFSTLRVNSMPGKDFFKRLEGDSIPIEVSKKILIQIVSDKNFAYDAKIVIAALQAIDDLTPVEFDIKTLLPDQFSLTKAPGWLIWLSTERRSSTDLDCIYYRQKESDRLFEKTGHSSWAITKRLNEEIALEQNLTVQLALILAPQKGFDRTAREKDRRVLQDELIWSTGTVAPSQNPSETSSSSEKLLVVIFFLIFLFERLVANKRNQ